MNLKSKYAYVGLLILLFTPMLCISKSVNRYYEKSKVTLNKEGVVALGNISRDRDNLEDIFKNQSILIDSLRKESLGFKKRSRYAALFCFNLSTRL